MTDVTRVTFAPNALNDYMDMQLEDKIFTKRLNKLIIDTMRNPHSGLGKPEPLKHELAGWWSKRITDEHRLVYRVQGNKLEIIKVKYHYK